MDSHAGRPLSGRELEVLQLFANGLTTDEIAQALHLSPATVRSYGEQGMRKLSASTRAHAVAEAIRLEFIS
jgi:DNA-binding CsgD family transcriptional regulator